MSHEAEKEDLDPLGKRKRGHAKGAITRLINTIDKIPKDAAHLEEIEEKINSFPETVQKFENVHLEYLASLNTEQEREDAITFRQATITEAEEFEQAIRMWIAQLEEDGAEKSMQENADDQEVKKNANDQDIVDKADDYDTPPGVFLPTPPDMATLENERQRAAQTLAALEEAMKVEEETQRLKIEAERLQRALQQKRHENEWRLQQVIQTRLQEQQQFERELEELEVEAERLDVRSIGPNKKINISSTPGHATSQRTTPLKSTPQLSSLKHGRMSWEPTRIAQEEDAEPKVMKSVMSELISELLNESRYQQQSIVDTLQLPRKELQSFDGNPLKYWPFIRAFRTMVDNKQIDVGTKLNCLLQSCTGAARKVLDCCEMMEPEHGYKRAKEILESRYGSTFDIAQRWISKITERPSLKGPTELRDFADDLQCCQEMLKNMGHIGDLDNAQSLRTIWSKLPQYLQDRWTRRNHEIKKKFKRTPNLEELVNFVVDVAEEATDPVFSRASFKDFKQQKEKDTNQKTVSKRQAGSFAVSAKPAQDGSSTQEIKKHIPGACPCCGQSHYLTQCPNFKGMKIKDRRGIVMAKGLCLNCFAKGHLSKDCTRNFTCNIDGCGLKHNRFLHMPSRPQNDMTEASASSALLPSPRQNSSVTPQLSTINHSSHFVSAHTGKLAVPIVPARVWCPDSNTYVDTYAMLDTGTNATYCTETLCRQLGAQGTTHQMEVTTLTQAKMPVKATIVTLMISDLKETHGSKYTVEATVRSSLNIDLSGRSTQLEIDRWPHLRDLSIQELDVDEVHLLIGQDCSDLLLPAEVRRGKPGEPFAVKTPLGWAINGPVQALGQSKRISHFIQTRTPLENDLRRLWEIEDVHTEEEGWSISDQKAVDIWNKSLQVIEGHYSMSIPFKEQIPKLPDNRSMAAKRLEALAKRLERDKSLKEKYVGEIHKLLEKGYAEEVPAEDLKRHDGKVWYLPHHPVLNPKKPEKCRVVFDCAAKYGGSSLNDYVHKGPDLTNQLTGVLLRFRQGTIGFMADIEAMFHQVKVTPDDRDVLRFLWFEEDDTSRNPKTFRMTAHLFGGVWSPSCANFALQQVVEEYRALYPEEVLSTVKRNFYVDDCVRSEDSVSSAVGVALQVQELLARRGFRLTKYYSSSLELLKHIPREDWGKSWTKMNLNLEGLPTERALGILWNGETDSLAFDVTSKPRPTTKRGVLSTLSTVYDPLGYVSPFILQARRIFQQLCRLQMDWDEPLPADLEEQWGRWMVDLPAIKKFSVPRCIKPVSTPVKRAQLHHFADASEYGYGAVSFIRMILEDDSVHVTLIMAKSRLAPLKGSTIPRLELAGALEAVRLDKVLQKELEIPLDNSVYWVDSQIVLWYLNSTEKRFQTYVANRVAKILDHSEARQWRYVPTEDNPGDDASRGLCAEDLLDNDRWKHGPSFLNFEEHRWPTQPPFRCSELEKQLEVKSVPVAYNVKTEADCTGTLMSYYSSWFRLKKAVVWYRRFKEYLMKRKSQPGPVTVSELLDAEHDIVQYVQKSLPEKSQLKRLNPMKTSEGLLRVGGRLCASQLEDNERHPLILPYAHHVSRLIIRHNHQASAHAGVERVLAETRRKYWIIKGRKLVKSEVHRCVHCRKTRGKMETQLMASLPVSRVTPYEPPFSRVGVDYFGPFSVKRGRSEVKRYGCVFSCFATRGIHIEVAHSLDTDSFIHALERFVARRGEPKELWSDNGTNFVGARQELSKALREWNQDKIHSHLLKKEIDWRFNPPGASHMGGVWERQVRTIRSVLAGVITQQTLDDEGLVTLMTVVEGIINNRPITKLSDDPRDARPLTPNHILMLRAGPLLPPGRFVERDRHQRRWKQVQYMADLFWSRWLREYLPALQERQKWFTPKRNLEVGDLVLLNQDSVPRNQWPLGLIVGTHPGADDLVRSVDIRTNTGTYQRPVTKICLLECASGESNPADSD